MSASEAQIRANQANAQKSTGPRTPEGKEVSRANSYKHGLTGAGTVVPEREAAEIERRLVGFAEELRPAGEVGQALVRLATVMSVRMERCASHENTMMTHRARQAEADFVAPEGVDVATAAKLRTEAGNLTLFDPSPEAILARKYEAAAERSFFRALKELRTMKQQAKQDHEDMFGGELGSILPGDMTDEEFEVMYLKEMAEKTKNIAAAAITANMSTPKGRVDVPITVGKRR